MNTRNVLLLIIGTVFISVSSALIAVRLTQNNTAQAPQQIPQPQIQSQPLPVASGPIQIAPSKQPIPPPPKVEAVAPTQAPPLADLSAYTVPKEFDPHYDARKPLRPEEVKRTLLKDTPDCGDEYEQLCTQNRFLAEHPLACLRSKKDQLSRACFNQVKTVQDAFRKACSTDIAKFCPKQSHFFGCLKEKVAELTPDCRKNIKESSRQ
ncbi:hypothetical protein [Bdellovibrio sp. HCB-162]|uniref:hypothetical protein n=1 Tax=Bdellovibrio sp. HCB-162 TaxID=3394234 RepID=UPI0039BCE37B